MPRPGVEDLPLGDHRRRGHPERSHPDAGDGRQRATDREMGGVLHRLTYADVAFDVGERNGHHGKTSFRSRNRMQRFPYEEDLGIHYNKC